ncbi:3D-(3,5/4)-trihydroxycyclohexane-1,2-dione acylhydrolase (decyclizing) [Candidatus Njordibacter sp. Uisw_058]|uniref:3D-(3,5/4)-trihydroxycyclohexane-1,2-dione acylhydrolase (decyclizing) n=1 Tax=Candidatus Njordibacter sp. Uisw_058 TaxID=3230974 RepID=UPI003D4104A6
MSKTMQTFRLTTAQALTRFLINQHVELDDGSELPLFAGVWAIFGHGNVAGIGEALYQVQDQLPTYRGHNEQSMALAAIAFAKARQRQQVMVATTSIGPGATNLVTAAGVAYVNRLPVLLVPGDVFASGQPDPVLQQSENFADGSSTVNDTLRPVSRYFHRITRPEQLIQALPRAMVALTDAALCGPATISICQDVQSLAFDYPAYMFEKRVWRLRRQGPDANELKQAVKTLLSAKQPVIVAGGGVRYSLAESELQAFAKCHKIPVIETQAGKSSMLANDPLNAGAVGVTGVDSANDLAANADVVLAVGTRLQDFISGSNTLFKGQVIQLNVQPMDAIKYRAQGLLSDARLGLQALSSHLAGYVAPVEWQQRATAGMSAWAQLCEGILPATDEQVMPSDAQVVAAVNASVDENVVVVAAAGSLPSELHKHWRAKQVGGYHLEYGYSCMGYEICGGVGVKLACPERDVVVMVGDGSYMMMNSDIATAVSMGLKLTIVVLDNRGFSCINRLQMATGGANFNNLLQDTYHKGLAQIDFAGHARSMGAQADHVANVGELKQALHSARQQEGVSVVVIDTDPLHCSPGGAYWEVEVPSVSEREEVTAKHQEWTAQRIATRGY